MKKLGIHWPLISALALALAICALCFTGSCRIPHARSGAGNAPAQPVAAQSYSLRELQEDFTRLRRVVEKHHPMLYADRGKIEELFDTTYARLQAGMGELEFSRTLAPVVAALNCGHSNLLPSRDYEAYLKECARLFPLQVAVSQRRLYVTASSRPREIGPGYIAPGAEIMSINGTSADEILETLYSSISTDGHNRTRAEALIEHQFPLLYHRLVDDAQSFSITFRGESEGSKECRLPGVRFTELWGEEHEMVSIGVLLDMTALRRDYSGRFLGDYAFLRVGSFILDQRPFAAFLKEFFREAEEREVDSLVLDLRGNWGGPPRPAALLLSYLIEEPVRYFNREAPFYMFGYKRARAPQEHAFNGRVYLLMDGACFSTTPHFISLLKHHGIATLIGEEAGGSSVCTDGKRRIVLPNTGLRVYYSTRVFETATSGFPAGRGIQPDYEVLAGPEEILTGRETRASKECTGAERVPEVETSEIYSLFTLP